MSNRWAIFVMISALIGGSSHASIFGNDDRIEVKDAAPEIQAIARSVGSLIRVDFFDYHDGLYSIKSNAPNFATRHGLRKNVRFADQPVQSVCTVTLVSPTQVITATHCVEHPLYDFIVVFDYQVGVDGSIPSTYGSHQYYLPVNVVRSHPTEDGYSIVTLDQAVEGREPLVFGDHLLKRGTPVFTIQNPSGLPLKYSDDSTYFDDGDQIGIFRHRLDTFHGSSGAPIFNQITGRPIGIELTGSKDFKGAPGRRDLVYYGPQAPESESGIFIYQSLIKPRLLP